MFNSQNLTWITLVIATISMLLSATALWPRWKHGLAFIRDAVLWTALVVVVVGAATVGWRNYRVSKRRAAYQQEPVQEVSVSPPAHRPNWGSPSEYNGEDAWRRSR